MASHPRRGEDRNWLAGGQNARLRRVTSLHIDGIERMQHLFLCLKEQGEFSDGINNPKGGLR